METKILKAVFGGGTSTVTNKRTRTDYGQVLEIIGIDLPDTFECIFSNSATSAGVGKKQIGSAQRVLIPDEYLTTGQTIYAWILLHDTEDDGRHMYSIRIPVADMPDTSPEEPTPVEQSVISQAIAALNSAVDTTAQKAQEATESADRAEHAADGIEAYAERAEAAQQASESARDIALEAKVSAQTSAATTTEGLNEVRYWADIINRAYVKIDDWTQIAYGASQQAIVSEQASTESARQASQSAETASTKAQEASGFASEASQKASEAAQSASTAVQAKTDAETAKQASETAQGLAETARNEAVNAKTGAESARDEAQNIADGITGKVEQIDSNTDRIESLEDDRYKPYPTDTASGAVASFADGADGIPLKSCIVHVEPVQSGSGDPSPENVRPITGWTGCEVQRTGRNLADEEAIFGTLQGWTSSDGVYTGESKVIHTTHHNGIPGLKFKPLTQYTVSVHYSGATSAIGLVLGFSYTDGTKNQQYCNTETPADFQLVSSAGKTIEKLALSYGSNMVISVSNFQLIEGSTATPYEPYTGQTYPITFPTEAGTVYGGTLDVTGGKLVVDMVTRTLDGTEPGWNINANPNYPGRTYAYNKNESMGEILTTTEIISSYVPSAIFIGNDEVEGIYVDAGYLWIRTAPMVEMTALVNWTTYLSNNPLQVVYKLTSPIEIQLDAHTLNSIYGQNNIWADTGDVNVEYRADTRLYIEKLTQPEEDDMIADSAINSGQFFMIGNSLYRALANIASGATITVGTNAQRVSLSDALNLVNA